MMIELTQELVEALQRPDGAAPQVLNPRTQETFVLIPLAEYERLKSASDFDDGDWTEEVRELLRLKACQMLDTFGK